MNSKQLQALEHIERNGNLLYLQESGDHAAKMFRELQSGGMIRQNDITGEWKTTVVGQAFLKGTPNAEQ